jgi:hypothetical protein
MQKLIFKEGKDGWVVLKESGGKDFKLSKKMLDAFGNALGKGKEYEVEVEKDENNKASKILLVQPNLAIESVDDKGNYQAVTSFSSHHKSNIKPPFARSPYNFISLNEKVTFESDFASFDKYHNDRHSGYINIKVENLTPLFIRQLSESADSFGFSGKYGIPGSSFRGLIRSLCEIMSFGKFGDFDDYRLYYREMFGQGDLVEEYKNELGINYDRENKVSNCAALKAGWLRTKNGNEYVYPADNRFGEKGYIRYVPNNGYQEFQFENNEEEKSFLFTTGSMNKKKYGYKFSTNTLLEPVPVEESFTKAYKNDVNRAESIDNFYRRIKNSYPKLGKPVFFKEVDGQVIHYGHTPNYRLPFKKSIGDHIPTELLKSNNIDKADLVQGLFGDTFSDGKNKKKKDTMIASRLSFGDLMSDNAESFDTTQLLKILASPKPTTFQQYLEQEDSNHLKNWNSEANIRGFKMYWHKKTNSEGSVEVSWNESNGTEKTKSHTERVKPIKENATFIGKIWFQNLSEKELGLLLMALEPKFNVQEGEEIAHKIGLAKPLGFGSIKVSVDDLKVYDLSKKGYYSTLNPEMTFKKLNKEKLKNDYDITCAIALGIDGGSIWDLNRLQQLKAMMVWTGQEDKGDWLQKTRYMEIERGKTKKYKVKNEFAKRPVLPKPTVVKSSDNSNFI